MKKEQYNHFAAILFDIQFNVVWKMAHVMHAIVKYVFRKEMLDIDSNFKVNP